MIKLPDGAPLPALIKLNAKNRLVPFLPLDPVCAVCNMTCFDPYPSVLYGYFILYIGVNNIVNICMHRNTYLPFLDIVLVSLNSNI